MAFSTNHINQIEQLKQTILDLKAKAEKSKIQEEYLLKTLKKEFDVTTLAEAVELLEILIEEKKDLDEKVEKSINEVIQKMQKENLI